MDRGLRRLDRQLKADPDDPIARQRLAEAQRRALDDSPSSIGDYVILRSRPHPRRQLFEVRPKDRMESLALELFPIHSSAARATTQSRLRVLAELRLPGLIGLRDWGENEQGLFLVLDPLPRTSLTELFDQGPLHPPRALTIFARLARIIAAGHRAGHICATRDWCIDAPEVFLLADDQPRTSAFVSIPPPPPSPFPQVGMVIGTPELLSPEQIMGEDLDSRSDVYTLGALLYQAVTGRAAFQGKSLIEVIRAAIKTEAAAPSSLIPQLGSNIDFLLARAMAKNIEHRYQSADELAAALDAVLEGGSIPPYVPPPPPTPEPPRRSWWSRLWRRRLQ